jgi:hypothetical protein
MTLESEWKRIASLKVRLGSPANELMTVIPPKDTAPQDFYANAIHTMFLAIREKLWKDIVLTEYAVLALAALSLCVGYWLTARR